MVKIKQGNIFGRIGSGVGKGLAEQLPKEIERSRLASGLADVSKQSAGRSPFENLAALGGVPGITPQMIQSGSQLLQQQAQGNALARSQEQQNQPKPSPFREANQQNQSPNSQVPSITKEEPLAQAQKGYIPPTQDQIFEDAGRRYNENPALFGNDPNKAIEVAEKSALRDKQINDAYKEQHQNLTAIQDNVVNRLQSHSNKLGTNNIPANVYSKIEDQAIQSTKPKAEGGRGLTEQQAIKEYGQELDKIDRDYSGINGIGNWSITGRKAKDSLNSLAALQKKFEERNDTENFGDKLISTNKLSPDLAYSIAEPVHREPKLNNELQRIPDIQLYAGPSNKGKSPDEIDKETLKYSAKLAGYLGKKGSPLAVAHELKKKNYNPEIWWDYLKTHRDDIGLSEAQGRQLDKPVSFAGTINDWWLQSWSGIE